MTTEPTKHTPGPWHSACAQRTAIFDQHNNEVAFVASYGAGFGPQGWAFPWHHAEANARLIAAAPDLLAMLRTVATHCLSIDDDANRTPERLRLREDVWAVIEKAEGRKA